MAKPIYTVSYTDTKGQPQRVIRENNAQARQLMEILDEKGCTDIRIRVSFLKVVDSQTSPLQTSLMDMVEERRSNEFMANR